MREKERKKEEKGMKIGHWARRCVAGNKLIGKGKKRKKKEKWPIMCTSSIISVGFISVDTEAMLAARSMDDPFLRFRSGGDPFFW